MSDLYLNQTQVAEFLGIDRRTIASMKSLSSHAPSEKLQGRVSFKRMAELWPERVRQLLPKETP